jgi:uncharacterized membrane protein YdjX (TVP38/TMEM64 family)
MNMKQTLILGLVVAGLLGFFFFDLGQYLQLDVLKSQLDEIRRFRLESPATAAAAFLLIYVAVTALSLPGAAVMTLAAGAVFGFWMGLLLVSFASSLGATLAFLVSRVVLRDWVQNKFSKQLASINEGFEREGAFYLFGLRLVPLVPFFVVNLLMGLVPLPTWRFYWVSQLGMLAGTAVYVNAGTQLGQLEGLSGILSPGLVGSFVLLGLFPLLAKKLLGVAHVCWQHGKSLHTLTPISWLSGRDRRVWYRPLSPPPSKRRWCWWNEKPWVAIVLTPAACPARH